MILCKMDPEIKQRWLQALKSGDYQQTTGYLRDSLGYCCLGVLTDLYYKDINHGQWDIPNATQVLPDKVMDWANCGANDPILGKDYASGTNDGGATFDEIAELIEANL